MASQTNAPPIAIGGVGGSGTRVVAALFRDLGYYLGDDLNDAYDNLWFTLLFKRRSILLETEAKLRSLIDLFVKRMTVRERPSPEDAKQAFTAAKVDRIQHTREWLIERARTFSDSSAELRKDNPWGWKEPNTHTVIDRLFAANLDLLYIHTVRHPIRMSLSRNQNQLENWGPIFLNRDVAIEPRLSLSFWCAAHRRILDLHRSAPRRALIVDYDKLCADPDGQYLKILKFAGADPDPNALQRFKEYLWKPDNESWRGEVDLALFDPEDLAYVREIGYALG
ncbi:MAG TPA: sulfotransferase [Roseiarcus sp.]|nr:sulfotransferase [Roseiarcus sp.]